MPSRIALFSVSSDGSAVPSWTPTLAGPPDPTAAVPGLQSGPQEALTQVCPFPPSLLCRDILMKQASSSGQNLGSVPSKS